MPHTYIGRMEEVPWSDIPWAKVPWTDMQFNQIKKLSSELVELNNLKKNNVIVNNKDIMLLIQQEIIAKRKQLRSAWRMLGHDLDIPTS